MIPDFSKKNNKYFEDFYASCSCYNKSMQILFIILMFILGAALGSFLCCQVRRLNSKKTKKSFGNRSICLHCKKTLKWYDNIPIISWLILKGKCRNCHKKIGLLEIFSEIGVGLMLSLLTIHFLFTIKSSAINIFSGDFPDISTLEWLIFVATILFALSLAFLAIYDGMSGKLPVLGLTISIICAIILIALKIGNDFLVVNTLDLILPTSDTWPANLLSPIASAVLFGGIYLMLYIISKGAWVGDGDWTLATAIGLALGHPWLAMVALFLANFSACLIMYPLIKNKKNHQIYFGPFLVLAFVITYSFSDFFLSFFI